MKDLMFACAIAVGLSSCFNGITGSGNLVTENRAVSGFDGIKVSTSVDVVVQQGDQFKVEVTADDNLIQYIKTKVDGSKLDIAIEGVNSYSTSNIQVFVIMPKIKSLQSSSSSSIESKTILNSDEQISLTANSSSEINVQITAPKVIADASSSADINASGTTQTIEAEASSSASINFTNLKAEVVTAKASSSADINVFCSVQLNAKASSSGSVNYKGGATKVSADENSAGDVNQIK
jgi:hypothetical protein